jgi:uroporphyrin-III C-methyltransferase
MEQRPLRLPSLPRFDAGTVWLAGAGPGDPGLLTALALHGLAQADVVLHDALVADEILALANSAARLVDAGKRCGGRRVPQDATTARLIAEARAGHRVLRLKGGDPFVFGRGAEEAEALAAAGIGFRIVPGVTAGIGGLAYAGIPATHREVNSAVTFVTGTSGLGGSDGEASVPDWTALAASPVLVVYMGLGRLPEIALRLLAAGRAAATPLAIVSAASTPRQRVIETTLGAASLEAKRRGATAPALIVIGDAVRRRAALDWFVAQAAETPSRKEGFDDAAAG